MDNFDFEGCKRLATRLLLEGIAQAAQGDEAARAFLTSERAGIFATALGFHPQKLKSLAGRIESVDVAAIKAAIERPETHKPRFRRPKPTPAEKAENERRARLILKAEPDLNAAELGRRLGRSQGYASNLKKHILNS